MFQWNVNQKVLQRTIKLFRERKIVLPTLAQQCDPSKAPARVKRGLKRIPMQALDPLNLFRITWKNEPKGGGFGKPNWIEYPSSLTGVPARIVALVGKHFPIGAHKVGAAYGCLAPKLVTGQFDPANQKAVWPSTGNYCRGGAFDSAILGCKAVAILPEGMSRERFDWLKKIGAEVIATPGTESNVKEIYDECDRIRKHRKECVIFNQFDEFGNSLWHFSVTGPALEEAFRAAYPKGRLAGFVSATGSAGTISAGDYLRTKFPSIKVSAVESVQCPTLLNNGFGDHRIEGIGDKHVPWVHNVLNTDVITAVDDEACMRILRLWNEKRGKEAMLEAGVSKQFVRQSGLFGISSICNMLSAIKMAKWFELGKDDVILTVATDSADLYQSRLKELAKEYGPYSKQQGRVDWQRYLLGVGTDSMKELTYPDRKAVHNLKYFTWVEQQGKTTKQLNALWKQETWDKIFSQQKKLDQMIQAFNKKVGI